ncbi:hypothetical protein BDZ91DRAFT_795915 [Kalaharituber pfeilii]|nr:hypothetical protein BDZ91DRAFT_795915 [Kalaharituber pfeilii]
MADTGITKEIIKAGDGKTYPKAGDAVKIHYVARLEDGKVVDSTFHRGKPFETTIGVGRVIQGWELEVPKMSLNEKAKITIPGYFAYGSSGFPWLIPENATVVFEMELLEIIPGQESAGPVPS